MSELILHRREIHDQIEYLDDESELENVLNDIAPYIGKIIVEFNSLEESLNFSITELISNSSLEDDLIYVFLAEMGFGQKLNAYVNLCGQIISMLKAAELEDKLTELEACLREAAKRRNEYAHGSFTGISTEKYVCVKTKSKKKGIFQIYRTFDENSMKDDLRYIESAISALIQFDEDLNLKIHYDHGH